MKLIQVVLCFGLMSTELCETWWPSPSDNNWSCSRCWFCVEGKY